MRVILSCIFMIALFSCKQKAPKVNLSRNELAKVDSMFKYSLDSIRNHSDSMCLVWKDKNLRTIKDSIIAVRLAEIDQISEK